MPRIGTCDTSGHPYVHGRLARAVHSSCARGLPNACHRGTWTTKPSSLDSTAFANAWPDGTKELLPGRPAGGWRGVQPRALSIGWQRAGALSRHRKNGYGRTAARDRARQGGAKPRRPPSACHPCRYMRTRQREPCLGAGSLRCVRSVGQPTMTRHAGRRVALPPDEGTDGLEKTVIGRRGFAPAQPGDGT